jgi:AraC-like DNA-binding protein
MSLQINIFLLLFGGVQGVLFSLFLIRKKLFSTTYIFLLLYLGVMLLQITLKVMSKIWLMSNWTVLYNFSHYLPLLYGPLIYLFVKHLLQKRLFSMNDILHFFPAAIVFTALYFAATNLLPNSLGFVIFNPFIRLFILGASIITYHILAYSLWKKHRETLQHFYSDTTALQMNWVKQFVILSATVSTVVATALFLLYINYPNGHQYRYGFVVLSICIYWFSYTALTKPAVFSVIMGNAEPKENAEFTLPVLKVYRPNVKYANSILNNEDAGAIINGLEKLMQEKKLYLQPGVTINQIADALKCSRHHLSQVLNDNLQKSYYDYINGLRIEEAKRLLNEPQSEQLKIASIAYDAGFNSLSTFNDVFKKFTGKTPSDYRKETLKDLQKQRV